AARRRDGGGRRSAGRVLGRPWALHSPPPQRANGATTQRRGGVSSRRAEEVGGPAESGDRRVGGGRNGGIRGAVAVQWDNDSALAELRPLLWSYLRAHAKHVEPGVVVEELWQLPRGQFDQLVSTHLALSNAAPEALDSCRGVLRTLPSTVARREEEVI